MQGVVLDAGPFLALERRNPVVVHLVDRLFSETIPLLTSAAVVAQVWRGGSHQAPLVRLLARVEIVALDATVAKFIGRLLGRSRMKDVVDAHVVWLAQTRNWRVLTSDPEDLRRLDATIELVAI
jgi:hypothetical protein